MSNHFFDIQPILAAAGTEWIPIVVSLITAILTVGSSFWVSRHKQRTTDFEAIVEERKGFTEELRKELKRKQEEHNQEMAELEDKIKAQKLTIQQLEGETVVLKAEIAELKHQYGLAHRHP